MTEQGWFMHIDCHCKSRGFTLLEVLITVVVLSTGLVLVLQGLHGVLHVWQGAVQRTRTVMAAQEQFAGIRHAALWGRAPQAESALRVHARVAGHAGLYRVVYQAEESMFDVGAQYEMLVYVPHDQEERP